MSIPSRTFIKNPQAVIAIFGQQAYDELNALLNPCCGGGDSGTPYSILNSIQYNNNGQFFGDVLATRNPTTNDTVLGQNQIDGDFAELIVTNNFQGLGVPFAGIGRTHLPFTPGGNGVIMGALNGTSLGVGEFTGIINSVDSSGNSNVLFSGAFGILQAKDPINAGHSQIQLQGGLSGGTAINFNASSGGNGQATINLQQNTNTGQAQINLRSGDSWWWPLADGTSGQALTTDGSGNLAFTTVGGGLPAGGPHLTLVTNGSSTPVWNQILLDGAGQASIDPWNRILSIGAIQVMNWTNQTLADSASLLSIDWTNRFLVDPSGDTVASWSTKNVFTMPRGQQVAITGSLVQTTYSVSASDYIIAVSTLIGPATITLPAAPNNGETYIIKDGAGNATVSNITVTGNGRNIDGAPAVVISAAYGFFTVVFCSATGTWLII